MRWKAEGYGLCIWLIHKKKRSIDEDYKEKKNWKLDYMVGDGEQNMWGRKKKLRELKREYNTLFFFQIHFVQNSF